MKMSRLEKKFMRTKGHMKRNMELVTDLLSRADLSDVREVLEAGCGVGAASALMAERGMNVTGVDLDEEQIMMAKRFQGEGENLRFMVSDITALPFEDGEFDMILSMGVLHHIPTWREAVTEVMRVLKPGGEYLLGDMAFSRLTVRLLGGITRNFGLYTVDDLLGQMESNGCSLVFRGRQEGRFGSHRFHEFIFGKGPSDV